MPEMALSVNFIEATEQTVPGAMHNISTTNGAKVNLTGFCMGSAIAIIGTTAFRN